MKKLKKYNVVLQYDVQRTYTVYAKNDEHAEELVLDSKAILHSDHWGEEEILEVMEVA